MAGQAKEVIVPDVGTTVVRTRTRRRWLAVLGALGAVGLLAAGGALVWARAQLTAPGPPGEQVELTIPPGSSTRRIAALLDHEGVIDNARMFELYVRLKGAGGFQAGDYRLRRNLSADEAIDALARGPELALDRLTVPEGLTLAEIGRRVGKLPERSAERFLQVATGGAIRSRLQPPGSTNLEGLLFPETYTIERDADEAVILGRMVAAFDATAEAVGLAQAPARVGVSAYQAVIVASMIERESRVDEERGMVARVVYNRLEKGMPLGVDATLRYGLDKPTARLRKSDLESDNPYNTRRTVGLPPTPIAAPGRASLTAAVNPTPGAWTYYVLADQSGRHAFTDDPSEFGRLKAQARAKGLL